MTVELTKVSNQTPKAHCPNQKLPVTLAMMELSFDIICWHYTL